MIDVIAGLREMRRYLIEVGFSPRDVDGTDFQRGSDSSLRFKTGGSYGEVSITVWHLDRQVDAIRINETSGLDHAKRSIDEYIVGVR